VISQKVRKLSVEPASVANFNSKPLSFRKFREERNEPVQKFMSVAKNAWIEKGKLKDNRTKLRAEDTHRIEELLQVSSAVSQNFFVRDDLRNFDGEYEFPRCSSAPIVYGASRGTAVKR
jgi:hypothetical protein